MVSARLTVDEFARLSFQEQIELVAQDIQENFWYSGAKILANLFDVYLFLHAQILMPAYIGKVLLLSPIVGGFSNNETGTHFVPPRSRKLKELAQGKKYPTPQSCKIHVGEQDWQSYPEHVSGFGKLLNVLVTIVPRAGHMLS